jgi:peptide/nickel transport system substrate-binding protein
LWTFKLRPGVKFHDGSDFNADAVVWNLEKVFNKDAAQFDQRQASQVRPRLPSIASYKKLDDMTIEIKTKMVDALFPYQMLWFLVASPANWEKQGKDWNKVASEPSGTGPFKLARLVPRERAELVKNDAYWNPKRSPRSDRIVLICAPEDSSRTAALLSNSVDMIETPPPDAVARLKQSGMRIEQNVTPHVWNYHPSLLPGSPWTDVRLRKAANLAIDREAIVKLLGGLAKPALGQVDPSSPWFGKPSFVLKYAPDEARKLMGDAGFSKTQPLKTRFVVASGGTGQMLSLPMNEAIQEMFKEVYIDLEFKVVELEALYTAWRAGAKADMNKDITANNIAYVTSDPVYAITRFFASNQGAPVGVNWSYYANPDVDKLIDEALNTFDAARQDALMARVHEKVVDDAVLIWVVHDTNPHALSPKITSYIQAQHWFQDLTTIGV